MNVKYCRCEPTSSLSHHLEDHYRAYCCTTRSSCPSHTPHLPAAPLLTCASSCTSRASKTWRVHVLLQEAAAAAAVCPCPCPCSCCCCLASAAAQCPYTMRTSQAARGAGTWQCHRACSSTCLGKGQGKERTLVGWLGGGEGRDPKSGTDPGITHTGKYTSRQIWKGSVLSGWGTNKSRMDQFLPLHAPHPTPIGKVWHRGRQVCEAVAAPAGGQLVQPCHALLVRRGRM